MLLTIDELDAFLLRRDLVVRGGGCFRAPTSSHEAVAGLWYLMLWFVYVLVEARALQSQRGCLTGISRHIGCHASKGVVATYLSTSLPIIPEETQCPSYGWLTLVAYNRVVFFNIFARSHEFSMLCRAILVHLQA